MTNNSWMPMFGKKNFFYFLFTSFKTEGELSQKNQTRKQNLFLSISHHLTQSSDITHRKRKSESKVWESAISSAKGVQKEIGSGIGGRFF